MRCIRQILASIAALAIFVLATTVGGASAHEVTFAAVHDGVTVASPMSSDMDRRNCDNAADKHSIPCQSSAAGHCVSVLIGPEAHKMARRAASYRRWSFVEANILNGHTHKQESPPPRV